MESCGYQARRYQYLSRAKPGKPLLTEMLLTYLDLVIKLGPTRRLSSPSGRRASLVAMKYHQHINSLPK